MGAFADRHIADLPALLRRGDLLVFNDTKVIPARLVGKRGAASIEVTLYRDFGGGMWRAFAKGGARRSCAWATISISPPISPLRSPRSIPRVT